MNWREDGKERLCLNLGYYSRIRLEVLRRKTEVLN